MNSAQAQQELSEATVGRLILDGNADAFCELVRPYQRAHYRKAMSIVGSEAEAEDVAHAAVLKAFNKLPQFRHDAQFRTWLTSITINERRMWLRDNHKHRYESLDCEDGIDRLQMRRAHTYLRSSPTTSRDHERSGPSTHSCNSPTAYSWPTNANNEAERIH